MDVDRSKAKSMNVPLNNVFDTLQIYLGSAYVNDFTFLGRSFQVNAQADSKFRVTAADILKLKTRSVRGEDGSLKHHGLRGGNIRARRRHAI